MAYSISSNKNAVSFPRIGGIETVTISVGNSSTNNSFYISSGDNYDWFELERNRNELIIRVQPNFDTEDREGYISCTHNCDIDTETIITVTQEGTGYGIEVEKIVDNDGTDYGTEEIVFEKPLEEDDRIVVVNAIGGRERFYIKSVRQYTSEEITATDDYGNEETTNVEVEYDEGLGLFIGEWSESGNDDDVREVLFVRTYGRSFTDEDNFYIITLAHADYRFETCEIKVSYKQPTVQVVLSPSNIKFEYNGRTEKDAGNVCEISLVDEDGDEFPDYGYIIANLEELEEYDWLEVTQNPTSVTVECSINGESYERTAVIIIESEDHSSSAELTITQDGYTDYSIYIGDKVLTFDSDYTDYFTITVKTYGYTGNDISLIQLDGGGSWCNISSIVLSVQGALYNEYTITLEITSENTGAAERSCTLVVTHPKDGSITAECAIIQYGVAETESIQNVSINGDTITVLTDPENSQIIVNKTGYWCNFTITGNVITVTCDQNQWTNTRYCKIIVTNAENPLNSLYYKVTQPTGYDFSISLEG